MSALPSLNQSLTAAWNVTPTASSSSPSSTPQASSSRDGAPKKRIKRTIALNSTIASGTSTPDGLTPTEERPSTPPPRRKKVRSAGDRGDVSSKYAPPDLDLEQLGGVAVQKAALQEAVVLPLLYPDIFAFSGHQRPCGVLLHGVPGGGKTHLVRCLAGSLKLPFISVSAPSIVSGMSGESEKTLRDTFDEAKKLAPCLLFLDEVDAITPKRETAQREMERRIVAQLLTCMDDLASSKETVIVIGATNRPDSLDPALRRAGRFDREIEIGVPSLEAREEILRRLCSELKVSDDVNFRALAKLTPGYVAADLNALTAEAGVIAIRRFFEDMMAARPSQPVVDGMEHMAIDDSTPASTYIPATDIRHTPLSRFILAFPPPLQADQLGALPLRNDDFESALKTVQPSAKREGFATIPDVTWSDVGALQPIRDELHYAIVEPIRRPERFMKFGIDAPSGVLLWGPPGCGKTLLAKAVANESRANFISVKGPELLNKYVGESERAVRQIFTRARTSSPCVIFFDELDALVPRRDDSMSESSARLVNTLLTELDGLDARKAVYVIGATNRPDMIDPAMIRPGRLDKSLYVDLPSASERFEILKTHLKRTPVLESDWKGIEAIVAGEQCDGFSGADIANLVREAATIALRADLDMERSQNGTIEEDMGGYGGLTAEEGRRGDRVETVTTEHFALAAKKTRPSVSKEQRQKYERLRDKYAGVSRIRKIREEKDEPAEVVDGGMAA